MTITVIVNDKYLDTLNRSLSTYGTAIMTTVVENWLVDRQSMFNAYDAKIFQAKFEALSATDQLAILAKLNTAPVV